MIRSNIINWFKKNPLVHSIFILLGLVLLLIVTVVILFFLKFYVLDSLTERIIDKKFHAEIATIPQVKVTNFRLWEGDSMVDIDIQNEQSSSTNKESVSFWYGKNGVPRITKIGTYHTSVTCFYVDSKSNKTGYVHDTGLVLDNNSLYKKWFPFQVNNIRDLVNRYDSILTILNTFPKNPAKVIFEDNWGKREVLKNPNPEFMIKDRHNGKDIACDLYID